MRSSDGVDGVEDSVLCLISSGFGSKVGGVKMIRFQINKIRELNGLRTLRRVQTNTNNKHNNVRDLVRVSGRFLMKIILKELSSCSCNDTIPFINSPPLPSRTTAGTFGSPQDVCKNETMTETIKSVLYALIIYEAVAGEPLSSPCRTLPTR